MPPFFDLVPLGFVWEALAPVAAPVLLVYYVLVVFFGLDDT